MIWFDKWTPSFGPTSIRGCAGHRTWRGCKRLENIFACILTVVWVTEWVVINVPVNTLYVISQRSLSSQSLTLVPTRQPNKNNQVTKHTNNTMRKLAVFNSITDTQKPKLRDSTDRARFSRLLRHRPGNWASLFSQPRSPHGTLSVESGPTQAETAYQRVSWRLARESFQVCHKVTKHSTTRYSLWLIHWSQAFIRNNGANCWPNIDICL